MSYPPELKDLWDPPANFYEYFIFGVEDLKSYCLPFEITNLSRILASQQPIPENSKLFNSLYFTGEKYEFGFIPYNDIQSLTYFPLLKSRDRLISHDQIWEKICEYLKWEFIRSV